jgi:hypothetical protein
MGREEEEGVFASRCHTLRFTWGCRGEFLGTYGVGLGGVEVGAHDAVFLDLGEDVFGVRVGEGDRHLRGRVWG